MSLSGDDLLQPSSDSFWEVEGYRRTVKRVDDGAQQCTELMKLIQERAEIEKEYAKRLKAWVKKWNENFDKGPEYGTNKATLKSSLEEADNIANVHLAVKDRLLNDVQTQIKDWKTENYKKQMVGACKEAKSFEEEFKKAQKPWAKRLSKVLKCKKDYHMACKLEKTATNQESNARNSSDMSADQVKKLQEKVEKCRKDVETTRERYQQALGELNSYNAKYVEDMTEVFQRTQEFEHKRLEFFKKVLYHLHDCLDLSQNKMIPEIYANFRRSIDRSDASYDLKWWSQSRGVDMAMAWPVFEEYSPEFTDITRKKFTDVSDSGSVTLKRITTNRYNNEFAPSEYTTEFHSISHRDHVKGVVPIENVRLTALQRPEPFSVVPDSSVYTTSSDVVAPTTASFDSHSSGKSVSPDEWDMYANAVDPTPNADGVPVKALFDYVGQEEDELSFKAGEVFLKIKDRDDQGWCTGRVGGRVGLYPDNYVELVTE